MSKNHELNHLGIGPYRDRRESAAAWREFRSDAFDALLMGAFLAMLIWGGVFDTNGFFAWVGW